jgi:hypothetical protein
MQPGLLCYVPKRKIQAPWLTLDAARQLVSQSQVIDSEQPYTSDKCSRSPGAGIACASCTRRGMRHCTRRMLHRRQGLS